MQSLGHKMSQNLILMMNFQTNGGVSSYFYAINLIKVKKKWLL
jgi:hypothetical protein